MVGVLPNISFQFGSGFAGLGGTGCGGLRLAALGAEV